MYCSGSYYPYSIPFLSFTPRRQTHIKNILQQFPAIDNGNTSSTSSTNTNTQGISPSNSISPLLDNSSLEDTAAITTSTDNPLSQPVNKDFPDFQRRVHQRPAVIKHYRLNAAKMPDISGRVKKDLEDYAAVCARRAF
ncbi:uncharacterized protein OCT59_012286 [Rhizophagus irregularis]|uniref:uncharacterized protein n=1 Tax=Rhizophagus irregularis TaxID=588596 RepID=UPI0019DF9FA1|nr:hypothetical protein OCT59_012286 [Rhizophagus irregularis]GBC40191.2 hypothetical protein GLOIN_2v1762924 [Rhizophagus irregularis DAOM 181602=DAOM 197198]